MAITARKSKKVSTDFHDTLQSVLIARLARLAMNFVPILTCKSISLLEM